MVIFLPKVSQGKAPDMRTYASAMPQCMFIAKVCGMESEGK